MKEVFYKIASFLLSFIVIFSTLSFSVETHFCGDDVVDTSFFGNANACETDDDHNNDCHNDCHVDLFEKHEDKFSNSHSNCCTNETLFIEGSNFTTDSSKFDSDVDDLFLNDFQKYSFTTNTYINKNECNHKYYIPPILNYNYQVIFQSFLI